MTCRVSDAFATLRRAAAFFGAGLRAEPGRAPCAIEGPCGIKVIGNSLRELDRLLSLLLDELALRADPPDFDHKRFGRLRNTPKKLAILVGLQTPSPAVFDRLRAIGRSRDCVYHCGGIVRRGDHRHGTSLTAGWAARRYRIGEALVVTPDDIADVCRFYDHLAEDLYANPGLIDFAGVRAYSGLANVACDGK